MPFILVLDTKSSTRVRPLKLSDILTLTSGYRQPDRRKDRLNGRSPAPDAGHSGGELSTHHLSL